LVEHEEAQGKDHVHAVDEEGKLTRAEKKQVMLSVVRFLFCAALPVA
jgi:hypothetical protein